MIGFIWRAAGIPSFHTVLYKTVSVSRSSLTTHFIPMKNKWEKISPGPSKTQLHSLKKANLVCVESLFLHCQPVLLKPDQVLLYTPFNKQPFLLAGSGEFGSRNTSTIIPSHSEASRLDKHNFIYAKNRLLRNRININKYLHQLYSLNASINTSISATANLFNKLASMTFHMV